MKMRRKIKSTEKENRELSDGSGGLEWKISITRSIYHCDQLGQFS